MRDAVARGRMVLEVFGDEIAVLVFKRPQVLHHRDHRFRIVAGARHQLKPGAVGLDLFGALHFATVVASMRFPNW